MEDICQVEFAYIQLTSLISSNMRFAAATLLSLPIFAAATAVDVSARNGDDQCSGGTINCCNSTQSVCPLCKSPNKPRSPRVSQSTALNLGTLSSLLGIQLPNIAGLIGCK